MALADLADRVFGQPTPEEVARKKPRIQNPDGSFSTERSITIEDERFNGGRPTNIPTIWDGKPLADPDAIERAASSGQRFPGFSSIDEAVTAAKERSDAIGRAAQSSTDRMAPIERSLVGDVVEPVRRGLARARQGVTLLFSELGGYNGAEAELQERLRQQQRQVERFPVPPSVAEGQQAISKAEGFGEAAGAMVSNPRAVLETTLESIGASMPSLVGAALGSAFGPGGTAAGAGAGSFAVEYTSVLADAMADRGKPLTDPGAIEAALRDEKVMSAAREKAVKRGIPIAIFDALTAGLSGKLIAGAKPRAGSIAARVGGETALQAGGGAAGEATAQLVTEGKITSPGDVLMEAVAEIPSGLVEAPANVRHARAAANAQVEPTEAPASGGLQSIADRVYGAAEPAAPTTAAEPEASGEFSSSRLLQNAEPTLGVQSEGEPFELEPQQAPLLPDARRAAPRKESGFGPTLSRGQLDLFTAPEASPTPEAQGKLEAEFGDRVNHVKTGVFRAGVERASTREDAAHILAPLRKEAQESFMVLALDASDRPLGIIRHTIGATSQTSVYPGVLASAIASLPGVKSVWTAHNHPSGTTSSSRADNNLVNTLENTLRGSGIGVKGHLVVTPGGRATKFTPGGDEGPPFRPTPAVRSGEVPLLERRFRKIGKLAPVITSAESARRTVPKVLKGEEGIVFVDAQNAPVAALRIKPAELTTLRTDSTERGMTPLLRMIGESNATGMFAHFKGNPDSNALIEAYSNLSKFGAAMDVRMLDVLSEHNGKVQSELERGRPITGLGSNFKQDLGAAEVTETPAFRRWFMDSKVVDKNGEPLQVYHGTGRDFTEFDPQDPGTIGGEELAGMGVKASFFTSSPMQATEFAESVPNSEGERIIPVYLSIQNPLIIEMNGEPWGRALPRIVAAARDGKHDGVILRDSADGFFEMEIADTFITFRPEQVKSAIGNRGTFDPRNPSILKQGAPAESTEPFYSELTRQVRAVKQGAASPEQWKSLIANLKGVKADEIQWSGVNEWLELQGGKVTKEQLVDFLEQNGVKVEETVLSEGGAGEMRQVLAERDDIVVRLDARGFGVDWWSDGSLQGVEYRPERIYYMADPEADPADMALSYAEHQLAYSNLPADIKPLVDRLREIAPITAQYGADDNGSGAEGATRYGQYTLPGGENYRELLLRLAPAELSQDGLDRRKAVFQKYQPEIDKLRGQLDAGRSTPLDINNPESRARSSLWDRMHALEARRDAEADQAYKLPADRKRFQSAHFDAPDILAHVRFKERTDAQGKRVLFLEEIQSDWAQKGKRIGFAQVDHYKAEQGENGLWNVSNNGEDVFYDVYADNAAEAIRIAQEREIAEGLSKAGEGVPRGPFVGKTEQWVALALKRMIRWAADNGFDRIAWTTGDQQADRYDLSKHITSVRLSDNSSGGITEAKLDGPFTHGVLHMKPIRGQTISRHVNSEAEIVDLIGKEAADKLLKQPARRAREAGLGVRLRELEGLDLRVGGEGMRAFYDKILPNIANDVLKKLGGGRVQTDTVANVGTKFSVGQYAPTLEELKAKAQEWRSRGGAPSVEIERQLDAVINRMEDGQTFRAAMEWEGSHTLAEQLGVPARDEPVMREQPGFDITPALRDRALGGLSLFQRNIEKEQGLPIVGGTRKGYFDQAYKHSQPVKVTFEDGTSMYDAVKGLNAGHALWRAGENWPGAKIEPVTLDQVKTADPESYREITRYEAFGLAQLSPRRQRMYATLVDAGLLDPAPSVPVPALDVLQEGELPLTRGQHQVVARAAGQVVRGGMPKQWVAAVSIASTTEKDAGPANYNLGRKAILLREQNLNGAMAGEPGSQAWLATALAHEIIHRVDHGQGATLRDAMASAGATRLAPDGDLMIEAREAYEQGPVELSTYLAYPFATSLRNNSVTLAIEVTAQMGSLYATASDTLRASAPRWHALFEEVYRHAEVAAAHRALREGLRAQPAAVANQGVRAGADRGAGDYVEDRGSLASRAPGPGVGGVQADAEKSRRSAAARARIRDTDSLFVAVAKLGGLNRDEVVSTWGTDPADIRRIGPKGGKVVVRAKGGGLSLDGMAEALHGLGYLDERDLHEFEAKFDRELRGDPVYTYAGQEKRNRGEAPVDEEHELEPLEIEASGFADLPDAEQDAVAALVDALRGRFKGSAAESRIEEIIEEADAATRGQPTAAFHNAIISALQGIVNATQQPGQATQRGANQAGGTAPPARAPPQAPRGTPPGQPIRFDVPDPGAWDAVVRTFQDNKVDLKRLQAAIGKLAPIPEAQDAYLKDEARISRTADKVERFRKGKAQDVVDKIRAHGLKLDEVEQFLWARHAREANAQLLTVSGQDGLSGMSNADAAQILADFQTNGKLRALKDVAATVDAIIDETRRIYVAGGLEKQSTIDAWKAIYKHYVPLHREGFEDRGPRIGKGYTIRGPEAKSRVGSTRAVENILANVFAQHEAAIIRAEKNRVDRALWELFRANPNPAFWELGRPGIKETVDVDTGLPVRVPTMDYKNVENALVLKLDGDEKVILFNAQNDRARSLVQAMRNLQGSELSWWVAAWARANRLLANLSTSYNPVFWATNLVRDVGTVAFNLQSTELRGKEAAVMRRIPLAMAGVRDELRGRGRSTWAQHYREAKAAGGMTGWMQSFEGIGDRANEIVRLLRKAERGIWDPREIGDWSLQLIKDYNDVIEHATRTAVYATAIDEGMSKDKAASLAKNMSVNFNRKGSASTALGAFYMFFNASVQGSARMIEGAIKSKRVWLYMGMAMGIATALDIINRTMLADDDDDGQNAYDNIADEIKLRNLIIMRPGTGGKYWKIPLPYGYNVIANIGRVIGEFASKDGFEAWQAAGDIGKSAVMSFVPTGEAPTYAQFLSPSLLDPIAQVIENKNWQGFPLYREQPERGARLAEHERGLRTTPLWAKTIARELASATEERVSINPGSLAALATAYAGGLGYTASQTFDLAERLATGSDVPIQSIPLVSRFAGEDTDGAKARRYFELREKAFELDAEVRRLKKLGRPNEARELERSKPHLVTFLNVYKAERRALSSLYKEWESAESEEMSAADRIAFQAAWAEKRGRIYSRVIRKTNEARQ